MDKKNEMKKKINKMKLEDKELQNKTYKDNISTINKTRELRNKNLCNATTKLIEFKDKYTTLDNDEKQYITCYIKFAMEKGLFNFDNEIISDKVNNELNLTYINKEMKVKEKTSIEKDYYVENTSINNILNDELNSLEENEEKDSNENIKTSENIKEIKSSKNNPSSPEINKELVNEKDTHLTDNEEIEQKEEKTLKK